jgi:hypothetical protein
MSKTLRDDNNDKKSLITIRNVLWKSKLRYTFGRNIYDRLSEKDNEKRSLAENLLKQLNKAIDNHPKETRMILCEYIYKRRKQQ